MSRELDLNIMKVLINVYVQSQIGNLTRQVLTGLLQAWGVFNLHCALCHLSHLGKLPLEKGNVDHFKENF